MYCIYERKANKVKKSGIRPPNLLTMLYSRTTNLDFRSFKSVSTVKHLILSYPQVRTKPLLVQVQKKHVVRKLRQTDCLMFLTMYLIIYSTYILYGGGGDNIYRSHIYSMYLFYCSVSKSFTISRATKSTDNIRACGTAIIR